jgi:hypothetical protein
VKTNFLRIQGGNILLLAMACNNTPTTIQNPVQNPDSVVQDRTHVNVDTAGQRAFRHHEVELIKENNKRIVELKTKIRNEKKAIAVKYSEELDTLDQKNTRMERRLNEFKEQSKAD